MDFGLTSMDTEKYLSDRQLIEQYAAAGFKYIDYYFSRYKMNSPFADETPEEAIRYFSTLRKFAEEHGINFYQTHAPYPTFKESGENGKIFNTLITSIAAASALGAKIIVIHPQMPYLYHYGIFKRQRVKMNVRFYRALTPYLEKHGVICAIENMFCRRRRDKKLVKTVCSTAEEMQKIYSQLDKRFFTFCVDVGHGNIIYKDGSLALIEKLNQNITAVHLHDNFCKTDDHLMPGKGNIDWGKLKEALKNISFSGVYNLECHSSVVDGAPEKIKDNLTAIRASAERHLS